MDFADLCQFMANKLRLNPDILCELRGSSELDKEICEIICEYNKHGFLTFTSQPGRAHNSIIFKSVYHRYKEPKEENILCRGVRKQRAFIRGYMNSEMADFIFKELEHDPYIFVRSSNNNRSCSFDIKFGSVNFLNDKPVLENDFNDFKDTKEIPDADWSFNLGLPLRKSFQLLLGNEYPNIDSANIVEFEAVDIRWNENGYFWKKLLETIHNYKKRNILL